MFRPSTANDIIGIFEYADFLGVTIGMRGAGRSYGDASINSENILLDLSRFNKILDWNPDIGIIKVESGVTIKQLWEYIIDDGWWPPVVSGTMFPTLGGALAMNIHGKNNFCMGPIGDHVLEFEIYLPIGEVLKCTPTENSDLFYSAIGGCGLIGCFLSITFKLKKIYSGLLEIEAINTNTLSEMFEYFKNNLDKSDYLVGWIDAFAKGKSLGRGEIHKANYLSKNEDINPAQTLRIENQNLSDNIFGIIPKSILWKFMKPINNNIGMKFVNWAKWFSSKILDNGKSYFQSHVAFAFLLDYVPNWKLSYGKYGLIQYQSFIPEDNALEVFQKQITLSQQKGIPPFLAVFKRHREDKFLLSHAVNGYSLALDFKLTKSNNSKIQELTKELNKIVIEAKGKFYFAKDSTLNKEDVKSFLEMNKIQEFTFIKNKYDPKGILQTDLSKRLFGWK